MVAIVALVLGNTYTRKESWKHPRTIYILNVYRRYVLKDMMVYDDGGG